MPRLIEILRFTIAQLFGRPLLPTAPPGRLLRGVPEIRIYEPEPMDGGIEIDELVFICSLVLRFKPRKIFEFGTYNGRTTLNLAASSSDETMVYTLDLPENFNGRTELPLDKNEKPFIYKTFKEKKFARSPFEEKIIQLFGDSALFDYGPFRNQMDLVFVDASHSYPYVMHDSHEAVRLLRGGKGVIVWHDYGHWPGVTRALNRLYYKDEAFTGLKHAGRTTLAYLRRR